MTHRHVRSDGKKQIERLRRRPHNGQVSDFAEVIHFRDPQKTAGTSKLYDWWSLRLWMGTILVLGGHDVDTPASVRRCRSIWRRPEELRWVKRVLNEMIGDSWTTSPRQEEKPRMQCGVHVALERRIRYDGKKGCMACCKHAGVNSQDLRTRLQDTVNNEVTHTGEASSIVSPGQTPPSLSSGPSPGSSSCTTPAAGRLAPEVGNVVVATAAESSTTADDEITDSGDGDWRPVQRQTSEGAGKQARSNWS